MFVFNEALPASLFLLAIMLVAVLSALRPTRNFGNERIPVSHRIREAVVTLVVFAAICNATTWIGSAWANSSTTEERFDSGVYPTESFGLTPGESYPMSLGQLGYASTIDVARAPFYFSLQEQSGSAAIVSVTHEGETYFLEIPVSLTKYHQVEGVEPSMKLFFNTGDIFMQRDVMGQLQTTQTDTYGACQSKFVNFFWSCVQGELVSSESVTEELTQAQLDAGLPYWVQKYLKRAEITLTPEMHDQLIGKIG